MNYVLEPTIESIQRNTDLVLIGSVNVPSATQEVPLSPQTFPPNVQAQMNTSAESVDDDASNPQNWSPLRRQVEAFNQIKN